MAEQFVNDPGTILATGCNSSITTIAVGSSAGYPSSGNFRIKIDQEIMIVTAVSGTNWTVTRGAESTTATSHASNASVNHLLTAGGYKQALADRNCYVVFRAALSQSSVASIGFSYDATGPLATIVTGTYGVSACATFPTGRLGSVHDHFMLPSDWAGPLDLNILWRTAATTGNCTWEVKVGAIAANSAFEPSFNTAGTVTVAANGTTNNLTLSTISGIDTTGFAADKVCYFKFSRRGDTDTLASGADLFEIRFVMHRTP